MVYRIDGLAGHHHHAHHRHLPGSDGDQREPMLGWLLPLAAFRSPLLSGAPLRATSVLSVSASPDDPYVFVTSSASGLITYDLREPLGITRAVHRPAQVRFVRPRELHV